jgi:hypothetical protein
MLMILSESHRVPNINIKEKKRRRFLIEYLKPKE